MASRWANDEADAAEAARRKKEKEQKKRMKELKQRQQEDAAQREPADRPPHKRRRLSSSPSEKKQSSQDSSSERRLLRFDAPTWGPCRHVSNFETLNHIEEGTYGWVSRAREIGTGEVVALKKVKMDYVHDGFPITALREVAILQKVRGHANVVDLREVVMGEGFDEVVLVMEFLEHDLKTLQEDMPEPFLASETKTLLRQLASAVDFLHQNHIIHRDLKTSNILLSNRGALKLADFGMARLLPPPSPNASPLTQLVVTLWYRAPELLLGTPIYDTSIDIWSLGCIFGELLQKDPLLPGKNEVDQLYKIFSLCGLPTEKTWPQFWRLPNAKSLRLPRDAGAGGTAPAADTAALLRRKFPNILTAKGTDLLASMLSLNPDHRPSAAEILSHPYFAENPKPKPPELFPTFPSRAGQERRRRKSPHAPVRGQGNARLEGAGEVDFSGIFAGREEEMKGAGFQLRMG
ncbi:kinase-like protein [Westerdykella ornata]|uniref:cyclin-dependent kinase n=1 Tax=Westerdykella ornata TaxID=318751 RepID=A0A6A6JD05_WESOR|nr:kinase-like protein [Westerdykella ornata]KAF2274114.1 kinase-like protein [Westerdykella ornata]